MTQEQQGTGDELWDEFVKQHEMDSQAICEPSAAERAAVAWAPLRQRRRGWMLPAAVGAAICAALAVISLTAGGRHAAPAASGTAARPTATATSKVAAGPMPTEDQAFPAQVAGFTKVCQSGGPNCTGSGAVGPNLTQMINQSKGCRGVIGALYKDAQKDEFTIVVFGMKDTGDVAHVVTVLSMNPEDYEVGVLTPPPGSGLVALPADSGLVQAFDGTKDLVVAGLAQWNDGRAVDFQKLTDKLSPLLGAITQRAAKLEGP